MVLNDVNDENGGDTSDSDNETEEAYTSDDEENLSFESDEEGNYQTKASRNGADDSDASDPEDLSGEENDEIESGDELENDDGDAEYESDNSEELSFEEESDPNESEDEVVQKSVTQQNKNKNKKNDVSTSNVTDTKKATNKKRTPEQSSNKNKDATSSLEAFKNELNKSESNAMGKEKVPDEYEEHDTDDEEDIRNTVGNIPMQWYDEYKHIGYDWDAKKIIKPAKRDQLDDFLKRMEDPNFWRTVKDPQTGQDVILSEADIDLIKRINSRRIPDANFEDYTVSIQLIEIFVFIVQLLLL